MAIVIHTRKGKYRYAYEHVRVGNKVISRYMYPVNDGGDRIKQYQKKININDEYEKLVKECKRLKSIPVSSDETIDEMIERQDKINKICRKRDELDPEKDVKEKKYAKEHEKWIKDQTEKEKQKIYILSTNIKKDMLIEKDNRTYKVVKVSRVNCYIIRYPAMPHHEPQKVKIYDLSSYTIYKNS